MSAPRPNDREILERLARHRLRGYVERLEALEASGRWRDYPSLVSIETYAFCNAVCHFCPYPTLDRKGERMPTELFHKIIDELAEPEGHPAPEIVLCRVNEPLLDKRYFDFCRYVHDKLPGARVHHFSNATPLTDRNLDALFALPNNGFLKISFNDHRKAEHEASMGISYDLAYGNCRRLHERLESEENPFQEVRFGRVGDGSTADVEFIRWVRREFPLFRPVVSNQFDWIGAVDVEALGPVPETGCGQWFQLHFLADGREAFCCIDSDGKYGRGNASAENVLEIYNSPRRRRLRRPGARRRDLELCAGCSALV